MNFNDCKTGIRNNGGIFRTTVPVYGDYVGIVIDANNRASINISGPSHDNCTIGIRVSNNSSATIKNHKAKSTYGVVGTNHSNLSIDNSSYTPLTMSFGYGVYLNNMSTCVLGSGCTHTGFTSGTGGNTASAMGSWGGSVMRTTFNVNTTNPPGGGFAGYRVNTNTVASPEPSGP